MKWEPFDTAPKGKHKTDMIWVAEECVWRDWEAKPVVVIGKKYRVCLAAWNEKLGEWGYASAILSMSSTAKGSYYGFKNPAYWMPFTEPNPPKSVKHKKIRPARI